MTIELDQHRHHRDVDSYSSLESLLADQAVVLRVTDDSSLSPITQAGFYCTAPIFDPVTVPNKKWMSRLSQWYKPSNDRFFEASTQKIVNHVNGGWRKTRGRKSEWISTTGDVAWAIWEIVRRLQRGCDYVELTVIERQNGVGLDVWAGPCIKLHYLRWTADYDSALSFAGAAREIILHGRIFARDILETTIWTREVSSSTPPSLHRTDRSRR
jgi:hypothetical protein